MAFIPIAPSETAFKAPIDETLMEKIRENFDDHESRIGTGGGGGGGISFKVNGSLVKLKAQLDTNPEVGRVLDGATITGGQTFTRVRAFLKKNGTSGQTQIDIKRHVRVDHPITFMNPQLDRSVDSIGRLGSPLATQAITNRTPDISTQAINFAKSTLTVESAIRQSDGNTRYHVAGSLLDADYKVGSFVTISGMSLGANNGSFEILEVNPDGYPGFILNNTSGVLEIGSGGSADLHLFEYVFTNPVDTLGFKVGESFTATGHSNGAMNGGFLIERINDNGNNIIAFVNSAAATTQGAPAGTVECRRHVYTFSNPVDDTVYFPGEVMFASGHSNGNNNGEFLIVEVNESGNNLVIFNSQAVVQAGSGGQVESERWIVSTNTDPGPDIDVGDIVRISGASGGNDGDFDVKELNRFGLNNFIIYNPSGVSQGAAGAVRSEKVVVGLSQDFSSSYIIGKSFARIINVDPFGTASRNGFYKVVETNRGGGAATNIVCLIPGFDTDIDAPIGQVDLEARSIFASNLPTIPTGEDLDVAGDTAVFEPTSVEPNSVIALDVLELPEGLPEDLSVDLS